MKKESLARILVVGLVLIAAAVPFAGQWLADQNRPAAIQIHARMAENGGWGVEAIQARVGQPIHLHITSDDVVHGFAIGKSDLPELEILPGQFVDTTLTFDTPGKYTFYCTRWCGRNHWRMRSVIDVTPSENETAHPAPPDPQPLFLKLGLDIDSPPAAETIPAQTASAERGARLAGLLPAYALDRDTYLSTSPAKLWLRLRAETALASASDEDVWDVVAWVWRQQTAPETLAAGQKLYAANCAACHGETGRGDGVMVQGLPVWKPGSHANGAMTQQPTGEGLFSPPDFTDPKNLLGASPALLEGKIIRGGMGTGMPYWGPIFTSGQIDTIIGYLYTFAWNTTHIQGPK